MNLPRSLKHLIIAATLIAYCNFNQSLDYLPEDLESLTMKLTSNFTMPINNLPQRLKHLYFILEDNYIFKGTFILEYYNKSPLGPF